MKDKPATPDRDVFYESGHWFCVDSYNTTIVYGSGTTEQSAIDDANNQAKHDED